jgi:hypothetical protein
MQGPCLGGATLRCGRVAALTLESPQFLCDSDLGCDNGSLPDELLSFSLGTRVKR